jgi:hypothetical protein
VRAKTKSRDQVCRSCCDLISAGTKKWQSHREPLDLLTTLPDRIKPIGPVLLSLSRGEQEVAPTLFSLDADKLRSRDSAQQLLSHQSHICRQLRLSHIRDCDGVLKRAAGVVWVGHWRAFALEGQETRPARIEVSGTDGASPLKQERTQSQPPGHAINALASPPQSLQALPPPQPGPIDPSIAARTAQVGAMANPPQLQPQCPHPPQRG